MNLALIDIRKNSTIINQILILSRHILGFYYPPVKSFIYFIKILTYSLMELLITLKD